MQSALFVFRKKITDKEGNSVYNDNFINPMVVQSAYWTVGENGERTLSVFLPTYTFTFPQTTGERFINHMEDFLRYLIAAPQAETRARNTESRNTEPRKPRAPIATEEFVEEPANTGAAWEG